VRDERTKQCQACGKTAITDPYRCAICGVHLTPGCVVLYKHAEDKHEPLRVCRSCSRTGKEVVRIPGEYRAKDDD